MPSTQVQYLKKSELAFAHFRREVIVLLLSTLMSAILCLLASCTVFVNFLANKSRAEQKNIPHLLTRYGVSLSERLQKSIFQACATFL